MDHSRYNQPGQLQPEMDSRQHNRFSWQAPLQEEARTYEEPQQHMPPQQPQQPQPSTDVSSRHFSYAQTPAEHRAFVYTSSPNDPPLPQTRISVAASLFTPIDPRPQSMLDPNFVAPPVPQLAYVPPSYSQDEKPPISLPAHHNHNEQQYHHHPAQRMVMPQPAHDPQTNTQQTRHARQMSNLSPINTNLTARPMPPIPPTPQSGTQTSPLPYKTPISATSTTQPNPAQTSPPPTPYSPHNFPSTLTNPTLATIFSPNAPHGPNGLAPTTHQPGQIPHPNMSTSSSKTWSSSGYSCTPSPSTCLTGVFCPCILYGRTAHRLSQKSQKKDATDLLGHRTPNAHCLLMSMACGVWCLFPALQRLRIRRLYGIEGSFGGDLARACACCCCVGVGNEREVLGREGERRRWAGPAAGAGVEGYGGYGYRREGGMRYVAQQ